MVRARSTAARRGPRERRRAFAYDECPATARNGEEVESCPYQTAPRAVVEELFACCLLFSIGIAYSYNFVFRVSFGNTTAEFIGWERSPFRAEVGFASLGGFSAGGFMASRAGFPGGLGRPGRRRGCGAHLLPPGRSLGPRPPEMVVADDFAPSNAGVIFYTGIGILLIGFAFLWFRYGLGRESSPAPVEVPTAESVGT